MSEGMSRQRAAELDAAGFDPAQKALVQWSFEAEHQLENALLAEAEAGLYRDCAQALHRGFVTISAITSMLLRSTRAHRDALVAMNDLAIYAAAKIRAADPCIQPVRCREVFSTWTVFE
ncbi:hypothetical protein, partial [Streptomyces roseolus]|uniref:hypothetical protein n=1 Tax=Streptomyces roseolus TaxID=67358 RepID=UPI003646C3DF